MRITRPQMFMEIAQVVAKRSTCMRLNVGAVIVYNRRVVSIGYNGAPAGHPHCLGNECSGKHGCNLTIHAEDNAIRHMPKPLVNLDLYVTDSPCQDCAVKILTYNIIRVFFMTPYRDTQPLGWLLDHGVKVYRVTPAGYVMDWKTGDLIEVDT